MDLIPGWHPIVIHFAIGLLMIAAAALLCARFAKRSKAVETAAILGTWNLYLGALAALLAGGTGMAAAFSSICRSPAAMHAVSLHFRWAFASIILFAVAAVGRLAEHAPDAPPSVGLLFLVTLGFICLNITGYLGGQNVYVHGIGVVGACATATP